MTKAFVVINPIAGRSKPEVIKETVQRHFGDAGLQYELYETTGQETMPDVVRGAMDRGFDLFVAAGGDGTVSEVAGGLVQSDKPLGIIPVGTGNAVARDLEIPLNTEKSVRLLVGEHSFKGVDTLEVDGLFSVLSVSVGLSAEMMSGTDSPMKRRIGRLAYIWAGLEKLLGLRTQSLTLVVDGRKNRVRATEVMILNSGAIALADMRWAEDVRLDDGKMEIYALRARSLLDLLRSLWNLLLMRSKSDPRTWRQSAEDSVIIRASNPLPLQVDGDVVGETPVEIRMLPRSLKVIVPKAGDAESKEDG
jgi:diacylglycerol kinase (ATP)